VAFKLRMHQITYDKQLCGDNPTSNSVLEGPLSSDEMLVCEA